MLRILALLVGLAPDALPAGDAGDDPADLLLARSGAPAAAVALLVGGDIDISVAGQRARGHDAKVTAGDLWHVGSNTKSMTATLAARLVEAGALRWDSTVGSVLPDLAPHAGYRDVTLADLLAHRSGLPVNLGPLRTLRLRGTDADRDARADRRRYARWVLAKIPEDRGDFVYSNAGYVVAGAMMEAATGLPWEELMHQWLFAPLDLGSAGFGPPGAATGAPDQPWGHGGILPGSARPRPPGADADNIPALGPAGRVHLSAGDHLRYLRAHLDRPSGFLSAESWEKLQTDVAGQGYALGWAIVDGRLQHTGSNTFWFNRVVVDRARDTAFVLAVNDGRVKRMRPALDGMTEALLAAR